MSYDTGTPRIAVYLLLEQEGKFAFIMRTNTGWRDGFFTLPAGKVEKYESFTAGAIREAVEEVGITIKPEDLQSVVICHRVEDGSDWIDNMFVVKKWTGEVVNNEPHMHGELAWFALDALPENVTPNQRSMVAAYLRGETYCELGWDALEIS